METYSVQIFKDKTLILELENLIADGFVNDNVRYLITDNHVRYEVPVSYIFVFSSKRAELIEKILKEDNNAEKKSS